ncbi:hypothetical protein ACUXQ2_002064 [Cupriavidus metallidurans]|jgi:hypothetical protein
MTDLVARKMASRHHRGANASRRSLLMFCKHAIRVREGKIVGFCVTSRQAAASAPVGTSPGINRNDSADGGITR